MTRCSRICAGSRTQRQGRDSSDDVTTLSKRGIIRRLGTAPAQPHRLLDQTNYPKSFEHLRSLPQVLNGDVDPIDRKKIA